MKNILFKSLAAVVLLGGLSSCSDFLDQSSPSSQVGEVEHRVNHYILHAGVS